MNPPKLRGIHIREMETVKTYVRLRVHLPDLALLEHPGVACQLHSPPLFWAACISVSHKFQDIQGFQPLLGTTTETSAEPLGRLQKCAADGRNHMSQTAAKAAGQLYAHAALWLKAHTLGSV